MNPITSQTLLDALQWRYATKQFDPTRTIDAATWDSLEHALVLTPSSYGLQPWQFFIVTNPEIRAALRPHSWNQPQVTDCSHLVVFAVRSTIDEAYVDRYIASIADTRGVPIESLDFYKQMMASDILNGPRSAIVREWATRQAYIALGNLMTCAALLGVDACPMEGFDPAKYDEILDLPAKGFHAVVALPLGYRAESDKYIALAKVRFPREEMVQHIA